VIKAMVVFFAVLMTVPVMVYVERRGAALIQDRLGPNRVGPFGLIQPFADMVKLMFKEEFIPFRANRLLYLAAPALALIPAGMTFAVIPFGTEITIGGVTIPLRAADLNIGVLYIFALTSLGVYGIMIAGWSSNNKFSLMGGLRSSAQMISYELSMTLAAVGVIMATGSLRLGDIVEAQTPLWYCVPLFIGFVVFLVSSFAETNRLPFDMPEAENELVGGYHTEYSSMRFASFFMAEYINMVVAASLTVTLFLGGYRFPFQHLVGDPTLLGVLQVAAFVAKVAVMMWLFVWIRWTLPRFRYDQLMKLGWKVLFPLALLNVFVTGLLILIGLL
jgi:NADH-quinone oxidoreductase subunit H